MATTTTKKKGWPKIGTVRKGKEGGSYIKLEEGVEVFLNGEKVALNKTRTVKLEDPRVKVQQLRDRGYIDEAEADKRLERLAENSWLKYDLVCPEPRD